MVRKAINVLSPIAAIAVAWVSIQSFVLTQDVESPPATAPPGSAQTVPTTGPEQLLLEDLASVSRVLQEDSSLSPTEATGAGVPESIRRVLVGSGAVLLVPMKGDQ